MIEQHKVNNDHHLVLRWVALAACSNQRKAASRIVVQMILQLPCLAYDNLCSDCSRGE